MRIGWFLVIIGSAFVPLAAEVNFGALVELPQQYTPLNWAEGSSSKKDSQKKTYRKVDIFALQGSFSNRGYNALYVRNQPPEENISENDWLDIVVRALPEVEEEVPTPIVMAPPAVEWTEMDTMESVDIVDNINKVEDRICNNYCPNFTLLMGVGYRRDNIWWTSDLIHKDFDLDKATAKDQLRNLDIVFMSTSLRGIACNCVYVRGYVDFGWVIDGDEKQEDIFKIHRKVTPTKEISKVKFEESSQIKGYSIVDFSIAAGIPFCCCCCKLYPLVGLSYSGFNLATDHSSDFVEVSDVTIGPPYYGDFAKSAKTNSSSSHSKKEKRFNANFWTSFLGLDFNYSVKCLELFGELEFHLGGMRLTCSNRVPSFHRWHELEHLITNHYKRNQLIAGIRFKTGIKGYLSPQLVYELSALVQDFQTCKNHELHWQSFGCSLEVGRSF